MKTLAMMALCGGMLALAGCSSYSEPEGNATSDAKPSTPTSAPAAPAVALVAMTDETVEVGCGYCIYHLPGVDACAAAVMVKGVPVVVQGVPEEVAHSLCSESKTAIVSADVEDGELYVTRFDVQQ